MKRIFKALTLLIVTTLLVPQLVLAANDKAMFWQLKTKNATVYMFGSIHLADPSFYPLRKEIEAAFDESSALAVEADILNTDQYEQYKWTMKYGMYPAGETLADHVSEETLQELEDALTKFKTPMPMGMIMRQRPGLTMVTLGYLIAMESGLDPEQGLDMHFLKQATAEGKKIIELEGTEQLMKVIADLEPAEMVIQSTLQQLDETDELLNQMIDAWKSGDEKAMAQMAIDDQMEDTEESRKMMDIFLFDRNHGMAEKIEGFIKEGGTYFVVVGAAHLVGDQGVPALLKEAGYEVLRR